MAAAFEHLLNLTLPGALVLARGRILLGAALLTVALLGLCAISLVLLGIPGFEHGLLLGCLLGYLAVGGLSEVAWWLLVRSPRLDAQAVRLAHRQAAAAFLRREHPEALSAAWRLCRLARQEPGAWLLLRQIALAASDHAALRRAQRELRRLARRQQAHAA